MIMNHIVLIGRLTRDPELRYTPNGVAVANFDLAVDRPTPSTNGERETDFIRIISWQKQAEVVANYLKKGRLVAIEGRLQIRNYETQEGQKRKAAEVVANRVQFLEKARTEQPPTGEAGAESGTDLPEGVNVDDLPF
jgi:single-strand DNA-binding protein